METPKAGMHRPRALASALCLASAVCFLWFLYWIGYDIVVWSKPLFQVNPLNYVGAILSSAIFLGGSRLATVKNMVGIRKKKGDEIPVSVLEQGVAEKRVGIVEQGDEDAKPLPVLQGLKTIEDYIREQRQESAVVLIERLQLERKEANKIRMRRGLQTLKDELIELRHEYEELIASLEAPQ